MKMVNDSWDNNLIQFARLISEAESAGAFTPEVLEQMSQDMDLDISDICVVIDNAQKLFDDIKNK
jgi:hypothetical protein